MLTLANHPAVRPMFLITVDTEGDNLWGSPRQITTANSRFLPRFQALCEKYRLKPTYLTNYEMAICPRFRELAQEVLRRGQAEIGMHLHAWNSPPIVPLTDDDYQHIPYLIEYPPEVVREKVHALTGLLEETFGIKMVSHRAGRWAFNEVYAEALVANGYRVDCSVTPHISWRQHLGDPRGAGGSDYTQFPTGAYFLDLTRISRPGSSSLLEVPLTIVKRSPLPGVRAIKRALRPVPLASRVLDHFLPELEWVRPWRNNRPARTLARALTARPDYVEMAFHSSELMPGGSPTYPDSRHIERLYVLLEQLFAAASQSLQGATLAEFHAAFTSAQCKAMSPIS